MKSRFNLFLSVLVILILAAGIFYTFPLKGHIPVLMYHFIDTPERAQVEKNVLSRKSFERQLWFLKNFGYRVISLEEYEKILTGQKKPQGREIVITFDDGNYTFFDQAFPLLKDYGFHSAMFVVSGSIPEKMHGSMSQSQIRQLIDSGIVTIGSHSRTHPLLSHLTEDEVRQELQGSRQDLESMFNVPIRYLAYPSGDVDESVTRIAEEAGYALAFTTSPKKLRGLEENHYRITRIKISRTTDLLPIFWVKLSGLYEAFKKIRAS